MESILVLVFLCCAWFAGASFNPRFVKPIHNQTVTVGENAVFECVVSQIQGFRVGWVKANTKAIQAIGTHVITHNPRVSVSHDELRRTWMLHINNAELEDTGPYMCQLNTDPMKSQMGYLEVVIPPDIVDIRGDTMVVEGSSVKLECEARGEPKPHVWWQKEITKPTIYDMKKRRNQKNSVAKYNGPVLELNNIKRSDMGGYLCIASNGHPPAVSRRVQIDVKFRPVVTVPVQKVTAYPGEKVTLECLTESFPRGIHYWERGDTGQMIYNDDKFNKEEFLTELYTTKTVLTITNFTKQEVGIYNCVSKNEMNKAGDRVKGVVYLNMGQGLDTSTTDSTYLTEYEISLMPDGDESVVYYDQVTHGSSWNHGYSPVHQVTTFRTGNGGLLGEYDNGREKSRQGERSERKDPRPLYSGAGNSYKLTAGWSFMNLACLIIFLRHYRLLS